MEYYSEFNLTVETGTHAVGEIAQAIKTDTKCFWKIELREWFYNLDNYCLLEVKSYEPQMWYEFVEEMTNISLCFPDAMFRINRRGEDQGDVEEVMFKNGQMSRRIMIPTWSKWSVWYDSPYV